MKHLIFATTALIALAATAPVSATTVNISSVSGVWSDVNPNGAASGLGTASIQWGISTGDGRSGYNFISHVPPPVVLGIGQGFDLATFQHVNQPVTGTTITQATLDVTINFTTDLAGYGGLQVAHSQFIFNHNETPNACNPQPGCANDIVTAFLNPGNTTHFFANNHDYVFGITGFQVGNNAFASFSSAEGHTNSAELNAMFNDAGVFASAVPELSTWGMMLLGFAGVGTLAYRKRRQNDGLSNRVV
jgi:hypothetical protein